MYLIYPITFLLLGSIISKLNPSSQDAKGRSAHQVFANSGVSIGLCLCYTWIEDPIFPLLFVASYAGALSDTFSSEIGRKYGGQPFDIINWKKTQKGLSGGVSFIGTLGGIIGSILIASIYYVQFGREYFSFVWIIGISTMLIDSVLGSTIQAKYSDQNYVNEIGRAHQLIRGFHMIDNNTVNFLSILLSTLIGYCILKV